MKRHHLILILLCLVGLSACRTQKDLPAHYKTMSQRANTTITLDEHKYSMTCTMQVWKNELITISLQPMLGIEVARIEATRDSVWLFDKMNRRYTVLSYHDAAHKIQPTPSYKMIQDYITQTTNAQTKATKTFTAGEHQLQIDCSFSNREFDTLKQPSQLNTKKYKRVSLRTIIPL